RNRMKAYLIVDLPDGEDINECVADMFIHDLNIRGIAKYNDVPLRTLPEMEVVSDDAYVSDYLDFDLGWNTCLKAITGETE
ncbi:MAG: hypothetical protein Q4A12_08300, partial [Eubacteriales bacterium]|nr:hypothetical protein [Eubacteriales bacterium]